MPNPRVCPQCIGAGKPFCPTCDGCGLVVPARITDAQVNRAREWEAGHGVTRSAGHHADWWRRALEAAIGGPDACGKCGGDGISREPEARYRVTCSCRDTLRWEDRDA